MLHVLAASSSGYIVLNSRQEKPVVGSGRVSQKNIIEALRSGHAFRLKVRGGKTADRVEWIDGRSSPLGER